MIIVVTKQNNQELFYDFESPEITQDGARRVAFRMAHRRIEKDHAEVTQCTRAVSIQSVSQETSDALLMLTS